MNKYFLVVLVGTTDGKTNKSIYEYGSQNEAEQNFHKQLGGYMNKEEVTYIQTYVSGKNGILFYELWEA